MTWNKTRRITDVYGRATFVTPVDRKLEKWSQLVRRTRTILLNQIHVRWLLNSQRRYLCFELTEIDILIS